LLSGRESNPRLRLNRRSNRPLRHWLSSWFWARVSSVEVSSRGTNGCGLTRCSAIELLEFAFRVGLEPTTFGLRCIRRLRHRPNEMSNNCLREKLRRGTIEKSWMWKPLLCGVFYLEATPRPRKVIGSGRDFGPAHPSLEEVTLLFHHRCNNLLSYELETKLSS
jgi:hypothetical protein